MIKTKGRLLAEGDWLLHPLGYSVRPKITPCYQIGHGRFPCWGTASLEEAVKSEQRAFGSQWELQRVPGLISSDFLLPFVCVRTRRLREAGSLEAADVANNPKRPGSL